MDFWFSPTSCTARIACRWWASLLTPIVLGMVLPFWGVLFAPPLLAVIYAHYYSYRAAPKQKPGAGEQQFSERSEGIVLPPEERKRGND